MTRDYINVENDSKEERHLKSALFFNKKLLKKNWTKLFK